MHICSLLQSTLERMQGKALVGSLSDVVLDTDDHLVEKVNFGLLCKIVRPPDTVEL
jgi:hypothetical protein